ncbi:MAG: hypothetical protein SFZ02_07220 [bacterium]|nr:hypothetical protein [bacterium]
MSKEGLILQYDMFTGQPVDNRTATQKKRDQEINAPQQIQMFKTPEIVQLGMKKKTLYGEWMQKAPHHPLVLHQIDTRTPDEIECDLMREAQKKTIPLFGDTPPKATLSPTVIPDTPLQTEPRVVFDAKRDRPITGLRAKLRAQSVNIHHHVGTV